MSEVSLPVNEPRFIPEGAKGWPRCRPPRLPARGGLHPVRVGKRVTVKEARALTGSLGQWMTDNIPRMGAQAVREACDRGDVLDAWGGVLSWDTPASVLEWPVYMYWSAADETKDLPQIRVVYQGDGWLVVDKPKGLATMPRGSYVARTVTVALRRQLGNADLSPAHRLDRATGGLLLYTERPELRRPYQLLFAERQVRKTYRAVAGELPADLLKVLTQADSRQNTSGQMLPGLPSLKGILSEKAAQEASCTESMGKGGGSSLCFEAGGVQVSVNPPERVGWVKVESRIEKVERVMVSRIVAGEVNAVTYFRPTSERVMVCAQDGVEYECVVYEVTPVTGKTHQIRLHFAALGLPLVGDPLYGGLNAARYGEDQVPQGASPLHLDAVALQFVDPQTGQDVHIRR